MFTRKSLAALALLSLLPVFVMTDAAQAVSLAPTSPKIYFTTPHDTAVAMNVCAKAKHVAGTTLTVASTSQGTITGPCTVTFTPPQGYSGSLFFSYRLSDGSRTSLDLEGNIDIGAPGDLMPVLKEHTFSTRKDVKLLIRDRDGMLLDGASDPEGKPLSVVIRHLPLGGALPGEGMTQTDPFYGPDAYVYTPPTGFVGTRQIEFTVTDGVNTARFSWLVEVSDLPAVAPVATDDGYAVPHNIGLTVPSPGVLGNDVDPDSAFISVTNLSQPQHGTLKLDNITGAFSYTPSPGYLGADSFTYRLSDSEGHQSNTATVSLDVKNMPPAAADDAYQLAQDTAFSSQVGVLVNDSDPDSASFSVSSFSNPSHGVLSLDKTTGQFDYTPSPGWWGTDTWSYSLKDSEGAVGNTATVTMTVAKAGANLPPVAQTDAWSVHEGQGGTSLHVDAPGVLANDSDFENGALSAQLVSQPAHGSIVMQADGSFDYQAPAAWRGDDTFTYRALDPMNAGSAVTTATIHVLNDAPHGVDDQYAALPGVDLEVPAAQGVLANDGDTEGDTLTLGAWTSSPKHGKLVTFDQHGGFTYRADPGFTGVDTMSYWTRDAANNHGNDTTVTITVTAGQLSAGTPSISGTARVGRTLTGASGAWSPRVQLGYRWMRNGAAIPGATASSYTAVAADRGAKLSVAVTGSKPGYTTVTRISPAVSIGAGVFAPGTPKLRGTARVGHTLRVALGHWHPAPSSVSYRWMRGGHAIPGATHAAYRLRAKDLGKRIWVRVTAHRPGYAAASRATGKRLVRQ